MCGSLFQSNEAEWRWLEVVFGPMFVSRKSVALKSMSMGMSKLAGSQKLFSGPVTGADIG